MPFGIDAGCMGTTRHKICLRFTEDSPAFPDAAGVYHVIFDSTNWNIPILVTIHSVNDGEVEDPQNKVRAESIARATSGVKNVDNRIAVKQ